MLGTGVLLAGAFLGRNRVLEAWYTRQFEIGTEEEKLEAAERLGDLGSGRAVGWLYEELLADVAAALERAGVFIGNAEHMVGERARRFRSVLAGTGEPALAQLLRGLHSGSLESCYVSWSALCEMDPELWTGLGPETTRKDWSRDDLFDRETGKPIDFETSALKRLSRDASHSVEVRLAAADALKRRLRNLKGGLSTEE